MAAASCVTPLFVQVIPPNIFAEKLEAKLAIHFQSAKKSGGGECNVRVEDRERGIYSVQFWSEEAKKSVKAHHGHSIDVGGLTLEIRILPDSELAVVDAAETDFTNSVIGSVSTPPSSNFLLLQNDFKNKQEKIYAAGHESARKKIFLEVSATLNTDLLTKQQRNQVTAVCPTLKIERASSRFGVEKVVGHYKDIEKLYCHFEKLLKDHRGSEVWQPKKQDNCDEAKEDHNLEELAKMEVPSGIFEYFRQAYKEEIKKIEETFSVELVIGNPENGITSVWFASMKVPNLAKKAQEDFVLLFQKIAGNLKQETVPFIESHACEMIERKYKHIIIKKYKDTAVLQGPTKEVSEAKALLNEMAAKNWNKKNDPRIQPCSIEVDSAVFAFLIPRLSQDIKAINQMYCTRMETRHCHEGQLVCITFMPQPFASSDQSLLAAENFQDLYLMYLEYPQIKEIPLKPLEDQKRNLMEFLSYLQHEHPKIQLALDKYNLVIYGLPENILSAEKQIMKYLNSEEFVAANSEATAVPDSSLGAATGTSFELQSHHKMQQVPSQEQPVGKATEGNQLPEQREVKMKSLNSEEFVAANSEGTAVPDSSLGAARGASFEPQSHHKIHQVPSQEQPVGKATEVQPDECCPICLNTIHQKEVLPKCKHAFCASCIRMAMKYKPVCPVCNAFYGNIEGNQPPGKMDVIKTGISLPGHQDSGTISITYRIPDGIQTS
ncbi:E3 ubiquitin-protein ligase DTX3L isoform 2-T2 [Vipera latastei]